MTFADIRGLLSKYNNYLSQRDEEHKKIHEIIARISGISVVEENIIIKKGELRIIGNSILQNELFFYREKILKELHKNGITSVTQIR